MQITLPVLQPLAPPGAAHLVEVAFKGNRRGYYTSADATLRSGEYVVVEAERGQDLGRVRTVGGVAVSKCSAAGGSATGGVVRRAEREEVQRLVVLRADEERVRRKARELVEQHALKMKVTETEWQWDQNKLIIYFTAERRVDFRQLVRDLARTFRTRIELKQIGVRDEAALLGGVGRCGRQLCCATWLREIQPISLQLAKDQNLSLNPAQISGTCGRLMCCLTYEHDAYLQARKKFPREGKILRTKHGQEKVIGIDIWRDQVTLMDENRQRRVVDLADLKAETVGAAQPVRERASSAGSAAAEGEAAEREEPTQRARRGQERSRAAAEKAPGISETPAPGAKRPAAGRRPRKGRERRPG